MSAGTLLARYEEVKGASEIESPDEHVNKISETLGSDNDNINGRMGRKQKLHQLLEKQDWTHLNEQQKSEVFELILSHAHLFIVDKTELELFKQKPTHIMVKDPNPCRSPVYRYPEQAKETINNILRDLEERDIIERSTAAWLSPIVLVNKLNCEKRMCLDYRKVNTHLMTDIHPLPHLEELVENVAGNKFYTTLDLKDAYYQVMLDEESRDLTTFTEGTNLYRFKRQPFGLSCSASVFVRQLQGALTPLFKNKWVKSYLDDVIVSGPHMTPCYSGSNRYSNTWKRLGSSLTYPNVK